MRALLILTALTAASLGSAQRAAAFPRGTVGFGKPGLSLRLRSCHPIADGRELECEEQFARVVNGASPRECILMANEGWTSIRFRLTSEGWVERTDVMGCVTRRRLHRVDGRWQLSARRFLVEDGEHPNCTHASWVVEPRDFPEQYITVEWPSECEYLVSFDR